MVGIFKDKFGKDPRKLSLKEIESLAISNKKKLVRIGGLLVTPRGSVFSFKPYNINKEVEETFKNASILR